MRIHSLAPLLSGFLSAALFLTGCAGDTGPAGANGENGGDGQQGDPGAQGDPGTKGDPGTNGDPGTKGDPGDTGPKGDPGDPAPVPTVAANAVYMMSNDATQNEIIAFARADDGSLSPFGFFPTGGAGTGAGLPEQGSLAFDAATNRFFAVNAGDNSISMLQLEVDGSISLISKIASGGLVPTSITFHDDVVYVLNAGTPVVPGNISGFTIEDAGLVAIPASTQPLSAAATPGASEILFVSDGKVLVVTERLSNNIDTYVVTAGVAGPPKVFAEPGPVGAVPGSEPFGFSLTAGGQIVVSEAWSGSPGLSSTSSFSIGVDGALTPISEQVTSGEAGSCWTVVVGDFAYETNTASATITRFAVAADGTLTLDGAANAGAAGAPGSGPTDLGASADGKFLYVHDGGGVLSSFSISATDGTLTKLPDFAGLPLRASGLVVR